MRMIYITSLQSPGLMLMKLGNFSNLLMGMSTQPLLCIVRVTRHQKSQIMLMETRHEAAHSMVMYEGSSPQDFLSPPARLLFRDSYAMARLTACETNKWMLVTILEVSDFRHPVVDKEIWSNADVQALVNQHFLLWQICWNIGNGRRIRSFFLHTDCPRIAIVDPRTGNPVARWYRIGAESFCETAAEFLTGQPTPEFTDLDEIPAKKAKTDTDVAKCCVLTGEARAGLAAVEDLSQICLRKLESSLASSRLPYKEKILVQFKGRRYCQPRLVKPCVESMNRGDSYVLVTDKSLYVWLGEFCNVIEKAKAIEFAKQVFKKHDLGCKTFNEPAVIDNESGSDYRQEKEFWTALCGDTKRVQLQDAGPADEDEIYEDLINGTNVVYKFMDGCLRPFDQYCGKLLTCDALAPEVVLVIDFGAEMYVWIGKQSPKPDQVTALRQAGELWSQGYNYSAFKINPMSPFLDERSSGMPAKSSHRPVWGIFGIIYQGTETLLFKDKFVDWGDSSRLTDAKGFSPSNALLGGTTMGEKTPVSEVLMQAAKQQYTLKELVQPPLPDGVDPLRLETYLSDVEFEEAFGQSKEDFYSLPKWKQMEAKKQLKLF